jgi:hypothetical protein
VSFKFNEWDDDSKVAVIITTILLAVLLFILFIPKSFNGYYISTETFYPLEYRIYINWDFWPDGIAYSTTDKNDLMEMYMILKKEAPTQIN